MWKILYYLPRKALSQLVGFIVHVPGPSWLWAPIIRAFSAAYSINLREAEKPVEAYPSLGEFFVRRLKPGLRPVANTEVVHCADSRILAHGPIPDGGGCVQAKGVNYKMEGLLADKEWFKRFDGGYYVNYYLCPTDYHRVHCPVDGFIRKITYVPGDLWPVHPAALQTIPNLYGVNERVIIELATPMGAVAVVLVGATNVGSIEITALPGFRANRGGDARIQEFDFPTEVKRGEELGMFRMGSTVIVVLPKDFTKRHVRSLHLGPIVRVNTGLTTTELPPPKERKDEI